MRRVSGVMLTGAVGGDGQAGEEEVLPASQMLITRINTLINYKMSTVFRILFLEECQVLKNQQVRRILQSFLLVPSMNKLSQVVGLLESR